MILAYDYITDALMFVWLVVVFATIVRIALPRNKAKIDLYVRGIESKELHVLSIVGESTELPENVRIVGIYVRGILRLRSVCIRFYSFKLQSYVDLVVYRRTIKERILGRVMFNLFPSQDVKSGDEFSVTVATKGKMRGWYLYRQEATANRVT